MRKGKERSTFQSYWIAIFTPSFPRLQKTSAALARMLESMRNDTAAGSRPPEEQSGAPGGAQLSGTDRESLRALDGSVDKLQQGRKEERDTKDME